MSQWEMGVGTAGDLLPNPPVCQCELQIMPVPTQIPCFFAEVREIPRRSAERRARGSQRNGEFPSRGAAMDGRIARPQL
jgi:hypothetical protein